MTVSNQWLGPFGRERHRGLYIECHMQGALPTRMLCLVASRGGEGPGSTHGRVRRRCMPLAQQPRTSCNRLVLVLVLLLLLLFVRFSHASWLLVVHRRRRLLLLHKRRHLRLLLRRGGGMRRSRRLRHPLLLHQLLLQRLQRCRIHGCCCSCCCCCCCSDALEGCAQRRDEVRPL